MLNRTFRQLAFLCVLLLSLFSTSIAQDSFQTADSPAVTIDSFSELIQFYDSLSPDSQFLDILQDSTEDSNAIVQQVDSTVDQAIDNRITGTLLNEKQQLWALALLIVIAVLIGISRFVNPAMHDHLLIEVFKLKERDKDDEPRKDVRAIILILLFITQNLIFAFGAWAFLNYDSVFTFDDSILDYLLILTSLLVFLLLKYFAYKFTGDVLIMPDFSTSTISFIAPAGYILSLLLLPLFALKYYNELPLIQELSTWLILALIGAYVFYRSIKLLLTSYRNFTYYKIYLFIYLCAVEILPVVLILNALGIFG